MAVSCRLVTFIGIWCTPLVSFTDLGHQASSVQPSLVPATCRGTLEAVQAAACMVELRNWEWVGGIARCSILFTGVRTSSLSRSQTSHARADCGHSRSILFNPHAVFVGFNCQYLKGQDIS